VNELDSILAAYVQYGLYSVMVKVHVNMYITIGLHCYSVLGWRLLAFAASSLTPAQEDACRQSDAHQLRRQRIQRSWWTSSLELYLPTNLRQPDLSYRRFKQSQLKTFLFCQCDQSAHAVWIAT